VLILVSRWVLLKSLLRYSSHTMHFSHPHCRTSHPSSSPRQMLIDACLQQLAGSCQFTEMQPHCVWPFLTRFSHSHNSFKVLPGCGFISALNLLLLTGNTPLYDMPRFFYSFIVGGIWVVLGDAMNAVMWWKWVCFGVQKRKQSVMMDKCVGKDNWGPQRKSRFQGRMDEGTVGGIQR
jgi:hypothetical protein